MKNLFAAVLLLMPFIGLSQDMKEYKAGNGKTYHVGDTVKIGLGSTPEGAFKYVQVSQPGFLPPRRNSNDMNARKDAAKSNAVIKRIKTGSRLTDAGNKIIFVVKTGGIMNYDVWIEEAIASCEVTPCASATGINSAPVGVADELLKLKKLLDAGGITKEEYDAQKKKLLAQ
jgi:hypothetical protein